MDFLSMLKKAFNTDLSKIFFTLLSISTAHYVGFIENLPPQVAILGGTAFAGSVTSTFLFYAACCLVIARIIAQGLVGGLLPAEIFIDRGLNVKGKTAFQRRRNRRIMYRSALEKLDSRIPVFQSAAFAILFTLSYLRPPIAPPSLAIKLFIAFSIFSTLAWIDAFLVWPHKYPGRVRKKWKSKQGTRIKKKLLLGVIILINIGAYASGQARIQHIMNLEPVNIKSAIFNRHAQIIANIGDLYLLRVKNETPSPGQPSYAFVYLDGKNVIEIPDGPATVLPPIR